MIKKIKDKGLRWLLWRLKSEIRNPTNLYFKIIVDNMLRLRVSVTRPLKRKERDDLLYAIFDMECAPITFNITEFLVDAEYESRNINKNGFVVVVVPLEKEPLYENEEYLSVVDSASKSWRFQNIVLPIISLSSSCKGIHILPRRKDVELYVRNFDIYPDIYNSKNIRYIDIRKFHRKLDRPNMFKGLRATKQGLRYVDTWIKANNINKPIVTITIRNYGYDKTRNSNLDAWSRFSTYLDGSGYFPVIIPDIDGDDVDQTYFTDGFIYKEAAWNMMLRMAIYERVYLNFFVGGGPQLLAAMNPKCSYIAMNLFPEGSVVDTKDIYKNIGYDLGPNFKFSTKNQKLVYETDSYDNILSEFECYVNKC